MTYEEIKNYIITKITYDFITANYLLSKWYTPDNIQIVIELQKEIPQIYVDKEKKRFRLRRKIK